MHTKYLVGGIIVLAVVAGILINNKKEVVAPTTASDISITTTKNVVTVVAPVATSTKNATDQKFAATVTYSDSGFSPATVSVKVGDTVRFVNTTTREMEVASNPHPIHTDYTAFDQGKTSFDKQNIFEFTFTKTGHWKYHNHEAPRNQGVVIVE